MRMDRSDWKGNIKLKGLGQMRLAGSSEKCDVRTDGRTDGRTEGQTDVKVEMFMQIIF